MTKESLAMLEAAAARVEQAIDVLEEAQEILVQDEEELFEFPVGIIFSAQTSLRVVSELVKDVRTQNNREQRKRKTGGAKPAAKAGVKPVAKTGAKKGAARKAGRAGARKR
ncbi:MAG TPA: hypothetical protein VK911_16400 [Vicinamibacterales bacterium]|nr:hypothetical protein [Vicinamibacterales bacterium]